MKKLKRSLLYIQVMLLLVILQNAVGIEVTPYFLQRKKMLKEMKVTLHPRPKNSVVDKYYYSHNQPSNHDYNITINEPYLCSKHNQIFLLILIRTHYAHDKWRDIQRELLHHKNSMPHRKRLLVKYVFIFGKSDDPNIENSVRNESKHHRDIIQEDFLESYFNLTKKVITAWKWAVHFCPNAEYVMILNDELLIDLDKIINFLLQDYLMGQYDDHIALCYSRIKKKASHLNFPQFRAMNPKYLYKGATYPPYCHGWGYAAHVKIITKLYKASFTNPVFMPTDVWIGVLLEKLRLRVLDHTERYVIFDVEKYFADQLYSIRPGMIAVTDQQKNKHHELPIMKSVIKSMRRHWKIKGNIIRHLYVNTHEFNRNCNDYYEFYVGISIFTFIVIVMLFTIAYTRVLHPYYCRKYGISNRKPGIAHLKYVTI